MLRFIEYIIRCITECPVDCLPDMALTKAELSRLD